MTRIGDSDLARRPAPSAWCPDSDKKRDAYVEFLSILFAFLLAFVILGFVGKLLWNSVVVELISVAKPARSFWQIIGLMIFMMLLRP